MTFFHFFIRKPLPSYASLRSLLTPPLRWYGALLWILITGIIVLTYCTIIAANTRILTSVPARGGSITEGIIGAPRLINPLLATTDTDRSLVRLVYNGLLREESDGVFEPDLAASYSSSTDGLVYTFTLKEKLKWSSGKSLTSADVAFTMAQTLSNVGITTPDERTVVFTLSNPDTTFLTKMTTGIIPKYLWEGMTVDTPEYIRNNLSGIGSGPFKIRTIQSESGVPVEIILGRNRHYVGTKPYLEQYRIVFFNNQSELLNAINAGSIDVTMSAVSTTLTQVTRNNTASLTIPSTKTLSLISLTGDNATAIGKTIDQLIDKTSILAIVENGYGILPGAIDSTRTLTHIGVPIALNVENDPRTLSAAQAIKDQLEGLGIAISIKAFDHGTFQSGIDGQSFSLALIESSTVPSGYEKVSNIYTVGYPFLYVNTRYPILPELVREPADRYRYITDWHARINNVWKIFTH